MNDLASLLQKLSDEVDGEAAAIQSGEARALDALAKRLLRMERDWRVPGSSLSDKSRIDRLLEAIAKESF